MCMSNRLLGTTVLITRTLFDISTDSQVHEANMSAPDGPHVGLMNFLSGSFTAIYYLNLLKGIREMNL